MYRLDCSTCKWKDLPWEETPQCDNCEPTMTNYEPMEEDQKEKSHDSK